MKNGPAKYYVLFSINKKSLKKGHLGYHKTNIDSFISYLSYDELRFSYLLSVSSVDIGTVDYGYLNTLTMYLRPGFQTLLRP